MSEYDYSRSGNPTRSQIEQHLAKIMSAVDAFVVSSGMSALDAIIRVCCKPGEEILTGDDLYGGNIC
jgi:cystathionine beta-lyase